MHNHLRVFRRRKVSGRVHGSRRRGKGQRFISEDPRFYAALKADRAMQGRKFANSSRQRQGGLGERAKAERKGDKADARRTGVSRRNLIEP